MPIDTLITIGVFTVVALLLIFAGVKTVDEFSAVLAGEIRGGNHVGGLHAGFRMTIFEQTVKVGVVHVASPQD